ncbi:Hypothetical predicted protein [Olea europaea subsp. europaea]|uniref:Uncharacterized protein n=1 Tax=Olea europaea subsp. europaea TaxID=158383 RepID=A0A8S0SUZ1_OLEEU|nr:Hypothetical predicted protein [Olea europaea subsp. europaea]
MDSDVEEPTLELRVAVAFPSDELRTPPPPSTPQIDALKLVAVLRFCCSHDTEARRSTYAHRGKASGTQFPPRWQRECLQWSPMIEA